MIGVYNILLHIIINIMSHHYHRHWPYIWALLKLSHSALDQTRAVGDHRECPSWTCSYMVRHESFLYMPLETSRSPLLHNSWTPRTHISFCTSEKIPFVREVCAENTDARFSYRDAFKIFTCAWKIKNLQYSSGFLPFSAFKNNF